MCRNPVTRQSLAQPSWRQQRQRGRFRRWTVTVGWAGQPDWAAQEWPYEAMRLRGPVDLNNLDDSLDA